MSTSSPPDYDRTLELVSRALHTGLKTKDSSNGSVCFGVKAPPAWHLHDQPMQLHCSHQKREKLLCITIGRCLNLRQRPCHVVAYEVRYHTMYIVTWTSSEHFFCVPDLLTLKICALLARLGQLLSQPALAIIKQEARKHCADSTVNGSVRN